jgi:NDP-sugar pyrophosphorylase family protein
MAKKALVKTAVILAGGDGARLRPLTEDRPKTMVTVGGKPLLYWKLKWLKSFGISHVVIGYAYKKEKIEEYLKENNNFGLDIDLSEHTVDGETGEGMYLAINRFVKDENYLVLNGDDILWVNINKIVSKHMERKALITMGLGKRFVSSSLIEVSGDHVSGFKYGYEVPNRYAGNGIYVFNNKMKAHLVRKGSMEQLVFTKLADAREIVPHIMSEDEVWIPTDSKKDIEKAEGLKHIWMKKFNDPK